MADLIGPDTGVEQSYIETLNQLQEQIQNLTAQLGNFSPNTLEGSQSIQAINDRVGQYQEAINQYQQMLNEIRASGAEAKRGSALGEQAKRGYITGLATKRGQTAAEAMKSIADVEAIGRQQRAQIEADQLANLAQTRGGLANLHMGIAQTEGQLADAAASRAAASRASSAGASPLDRRLAQQEQQTGGEGDLTDPYDVKGGKDLLGAEASIIKPKSPKRSTGSLFKDLATYIFSPHPTHRIIASQNIFKHSLGRKARDGGGSR